MYKELLKGKKKKNRNRYLQGTTPSSILNYEFWLQMTLPSSSRNGCVTQDVQPESLIPLGY